MFRKHRRQRDPPRRERRLRSEENPSETVRLPVSGGRGARRGARAGRGRPATPHRVCGLLRARIRKGGGAPARRREDGVAQPAHSAREGPRAQGGVSGRPARGRAVPAGAVRPEALEGRFRRHPGRLDAVPPQRGQPAPAHLEARRGGVDAHHRVAPGGDDREGLPRARLGGGLRGGPQGQVRPPRGRRISREAVLRRVGRVHLVREAVQRVLVHRPRGT